MKIYIIFINVIFFSLAIFFISCKRVSISEEKKEEIVIYDIDSFVNKSIEKLEKDYFELISSYTDSLSKMVKTNSLPPVKSIKTGKDLTKDLNLILLSGDYLLYEKFILYDFPDAKVFNSTPYSLYLAQKYDIAEVYTEIYYYYYKLNYIYYKDIDDHSRRYTGFELLYLSDNERTFAIWSLLKAYLQGDLDAGLNLSTYFDKGMYLPHNIEIAKYLELKYKMRFKNNVGTVSD